ncbi:MAG: hypothetical protein R2856_07330 [Caldilineaceae bacterium]
MPTSSRRWGCYRTAASTTWPSTTWKDRIAAPSPGRLLVEKLRKDRAALPNAAAVPEEDFFQVWNFHQPGNLSTPPAPPTSDFHEVVSLCGEHFGLMRRLGLVVDLLVPDNFDVGDTTVRGLAVDLSAPPASTRTCCLSPTVLGKQTSAAAPTTPMKSRTDSCRSTAISTARCRWISRRRKLNSMMLGRNLIQSNLFQSEDTPTDESLPAPCSGGISIARTGHAAQLVKHVDNSAQYSQNPENGDPIVLSAEDLWHGTRFDIWDSATGEWHSLQQRRGDYEFTDLAQTEVIEEEGAMIETPSERDDEGGDENGDKFFYMQESLMRWDGWSLAAASGPHRGPGEQRHRRAAVVVRGLPAAHELQGRPARWPARRSGAPTVRGRVADPAGNLSLRQRRHLRHEPLHVPSLRADPHAVRAAHRYTEGESDAVVVLRSDYNQDPSPEAVARILAPPRCAQRTAEEHGMWDDLWQNNPARLAAHCPRRPGLPHFGFGTPDPDNYDQPYFAQQPVPIPYLPDPMARGASMRFIAADASETDLFPPSRKAAAGPQAGPKPSPCA